MGAGSQPPSCRQHGEDRIGDTSPNKCLGYDGFTGDGWPIFAVIEGPE